MVTDMLTYSGDLGARGTGVFLASHLRRGGPEALAAASARVFLGLQLSCAQCHDHPTDTRYKQDDFYGLVAYFAKTRFKQDKQDRSAFIVAKPRGAARFKRPGASDETVVQPRFLGRTVSRASDDESPREMPARSDRRFGSVREGGRRAHLGAACSARASSTRGTTWVGRTTATTPSCCAGWRDDFRAAAPTSSGCSGCSCCRAPMGSSSSTGGAPAAPRAAAGVRARARSAG